MSAHFPEQKIIKTGHWNKISLVGQDTTNALDVMHHTTRRGPIGFLRTLFGYRNGSPLLIDTAGFANHAVAEGKVGVNDTRLLTAMPYERDGYHLSLLMSSFHMEYENLEKSYKKESGQKKPYELGLFVSDMFEVVPPNLTARIIMASGDPEISQATVNGERNSATEGIDILEMSVEGLALLPNQARHHIFRELAKLQPSRNGRAHRLLSLIAADWYDHMRSVYSGYGAINANLKAVLDPEAVQEFQINAFNDLTETRKVIEDVVGT